MDFYYPTSSCVSADVQSAALIVNDDGDASASQLSVESSKKLTFTLKNSPKVDNFSSPLAQ